MEVAQESFAAMRQKRIDQMAKMHHQISSPKLREMLKEKCRIRMKESRHHLHDGRRLMLGNDERRNLMSQILREEIFELEKDLEKQEQIYREIIEEADQWLYEEMESVEETLIERLLDVEAGIICPVCQKSNLAASGPTITCSCGVRFAFGPGLEILHGNVQRQVAEHEEKCSTRLQFFVEPSSRANQGGGYSSLNAYCATCEFFCVLIS